MKKTKNIRLVLVTAILASCNRAIIPDRPEAGNVPDSSLTAAPLYDDYRYDCDCRFDTAYYTSPYNYFSFYYTGQPYGYAYYPGVVYRRKAFWHNHTFIVRGGFGKSAVAAASAASAAS